MTTSKAAKSKSPRRRPAHVGFAYFIFWIGVNHDGSYAFGNQEFNVFGNDGVIAMSQINAIQVEIEKLRQVKKAVVVNYQVMGKVYATAKSEKQ